MSIQVKDGVTWKLVPKMFVNDGGVWKEVVKAFVNDGGVWKQFFSPTLKVIGSSRYDQSINTGVYYLRDPVYTINGYTFNLSYWAGSSPPKGGGSATPGYVRARVDALVSSNYLSSYVKFGSEQMSLSGWTNYQSGGSTYWEVSIPYNTDPLGFGTKDISTFYPVEAN